MFKELEIMNKIIIDNTIINIKTKKKKSINIKKKKKKISENKSEI